MSQASRHARTRCVLWRPPHLPVPQDLLASLQRRHVAITDCTDSFAAMAHLCRLQRSAQDPFVLLLVSPSHLPEAAEVLEAAARYAPLAARWWYDARCSPKLQQVTDADIAAWAGVPLPSIASAFTAVEPRETVVVPPRRAAAPAYPRSSPPLRLTHEDDAPRMPEPEASAGRNGAGPHLVGPLSEADNPPPSPATLLTNEELAMLLSDDFNPAPPHPRGRGVGGIGGGGGGMPR